MLKITKLETEIELGSFHQVVGVTYDDKFFRVFRSDGETQTFRLKPAYLLEQSRFSTIPKQKFGVCDYETSVLEVVYILIDGVLGIKFEPIKKRDGYDKTKVRIKTDSGITFIFHLYMTQAG